MPDHFTAFFTGSQEEKEKKEKQASALTLWGWGYHGVNIRSRKKRGTGGSCFGVDPATLPLEQLISDCGEL